MSALKRLWTKIVWFAQALEGIDDPTGEYIFAVGKRVDKLAREVEHLERQLHSSRSGGGIQH